MWMWQVELHKVNKTQKNVIWRLLSYVVGEQMYIYEDTSKKSCERIQICVIFLYK